MQKWQQLLLIWQDEFIQEFGKKGYSFVDAFVKERIEPIVIVSDDPISDLERINRF